MRTLIKVATTTNGSNLTIGTFSTNHKASKYIHEQTGFETKPDVDQDPREYVEMYHAYNREHNDNMSDVDVALEIVETQAQNHIR